MALLATLVTGFVLGLATERLVLQPMIGEPILAVIMITVGLSFFLRALVAPVWGTATVVFSPRVFPQEPVRSPSRRSTASGTPTRGAVSSAARRRPARA